MTVSVLWLAWVSRRNMRDGIGHDYQLIYAVASTVVGAVLASLVPIVLLIPEIAAHADASIGDFGWVASVRHNILKIGLFASTLTIVVILTAYLPISNSTRGILAGLPIVPFGGLIGVAGDTGLGRDEQLQIFGGMIGSIWLSPAPAIWFIYGYSRFLIHRSRLHRSAADTTARLLGLFMGWVLTFSMIVGIAYAVTAING